jgi:oxygen-dependent protoporphyrinogen oxidase
MLRMSSPAQPSAAGMTTKSIAVLGAGATGLAAAYRLAQLGHCVRVFEQSNRIGGAVRTETSNGWLVEAGPNSLISGEPALLSLIDELGLTHQCIDANSSAKNRYVVRRGELIPVPLSPRQLLGSRLLSIGGKLQVLSELLTRPRVRTGDLSIAEFGRSHFGSQFVDYAIDPFVSGIYAGNPAKLSTRYGFPKLWELEQKHGSLLRGQQSIARARKNRGEAKPTIFSFQNGLQTVTDALAAGVPRGAITLNATLDSLLPGPKWNVVWHDESDTHTQSFDGIIVALPAPALAQLRIGALGERPLAALNAVEHAPVSSLFLGLRREQVKHALDGFGVLLPAAEKRSVLGILFSSSVFDHRAPAGHVALTVMVGGTRRPELAALPTDQLLTVVREDLSSLLGVTGDPVFVRHTFWPRAIPQYNLGYEQYLGAISTVEHAHPGLFIGGQARDGIALPSCLLAGESLARRAASVV